MSYRDEGLGEAMALAGARDAGEYATAGVNDLLTLVAWLSARVKALEDAANTPTSWDKPELPSEAKRRERRAYVEQVRAKDPHSWLADYPTAWGNVIGRTDIK